MVSQFYSRIHSASEIRCKIWRTLVYALSNFCLALQFSPIIKKKKKSLKSVMLFSFEKCKKQPISEERTLFYIQNYVTVFDPSPLWFECKGKEK